MLGVRPLKPADTMEISEPGVEGAEAWEESPKLKEAGT
jgi:hypothetical protein